MTVRTVRFTLGLIMTLALAAFDAPNAEAQFIFRPSIGLQSIWFNGDYPATQPISPGQDRSLSLGGGLTSTNNGARLQFEIIPDIEGAIRIPISAEYYSFVGKTTFSINRRPERLQRTLWKISTNMFSLGAGVTASFFKLPSLYVSVEGKYNYIAPSSFNVRYYYSDNGETVSDKTYDLDSTGGQSRLGLFMRVGTQLDFFEPFLLDFNVGYGVLNLGGKNVDPATQNNLLVVERERHDPEVTLGYIGVGFSLIYRF